MSNNLGDWQALAEIYLSGSSTCPPVDHPFEQERSTSTYCLCSRVFIKNYYDVYASTLEKDEDVSETEEALAAVPSTTINEINDCGEYPAKQQQQKQQLQQLQDNDTSHVHFSVVSASELIDPEGGPKRVHDADADNDANSCYYSASASHTDNYCSTDEHEHHAQHIVVAANSKRPSFVAERLHSSDSGADISENHLLDKMRWPGGNGTLIEGSAEDDEEIQQPAVVMSPLAVNCVESTDNVVAVESDASSSSSPTPPQIPHERNNSLPDVLYPEELANEWESYWNRHGEQLIWASWIEKYSDYIDPAFKESGTANKTSGSEEAVENENSNSNENNSSQQAAAAAVDCCSTGNTLNEKTINIFTFDEEEMEGLVGLGTVSTADVLSLVLPNSTTTTQTAIVVSNCSPGGRNDSGGQLVPQDNDNDADEFTAAVAAASTPWTGYRQNRLSVDDRLLSPRCESVNSSIPYTIGGATDSMTNVTRMTISSGEFCSSKVTSESSQNGSMESSATSSESSCDGDNLALDLVTSPHSVNSHSLSQFYDAIDSQTCVAKLDPGGQVAAVNSVAADFVVDDAMDVDQYWQVLWEKHFQEQYARHYKEFAVEQRGLMEDRVNTAALSGSLKDEAIFDRCVAEGQGSHGEVTRRRSRSVKRKNGNDCLPRLVQNLRIKCEKENRVGGVGEGRNNKSHEVGGDGSNNKSHGAGDGNKSHGVGDGNKSQSENAIPQEADNQETTTTEQGSSTSNSEGKAAAATEESNLMAAFGLPQSFGSSKNKGNRGGDDSDGDKDKPPRRAATTLKRAHESDTEEVNRDRIKDAFQLMGFAYENDEEAAPTGEVVYRKKHIRLHNRALKMKIQTRPKLHIRFDEEGNVVGPDDSSTDGLEGGGGGEQGSEGTAADPVLLHSSSDDDSQARGGAHHQRAGAMAAAVAANRQLSVAQAGVSDEEMQGEVEVEVTAAATKKKKRKRKGKITALLPPEIANDKTLMKYWYKRFSLFQLFDQGIRMDRESWFSVTPEKVAAHAAERCRCDVIVDGFCGVGGNAIQFAGTCLKVIAIDIDPKKIEMAKHNATIYGVADRIEFIVGDFFQLAERLKADVVFLSPPWGGPKYMKVDTYDLEEHLQPVAASRMMEKARQISSNVAIFLPRNSNTQQLTMLAGQGGSVEIEQSFLDRKLIALTAYYGELVNE